MNAVEIEEAVSALAQQPFDCAEFPFAFLAAFDNPATTIKRLRTGATNKSDIDGVLQTKHIHIAVADAGEITQTLAALKANPLGHRPATHDADIRCDQANTEGRVDPLR